MNTTHSAELSPLAYGAGLTLGLMMILGLPKASGERPQGVVTATTAVGRGPVSVDREREARGVAAEAQRLLRERRARTAAARP